MNVVKLFTGTTGLNTKVDPVRLRYDAESGVQELAAAVNVDVDDSGRISRVKGYTKKLDGSYHSLFCEGGTALVVTGDALCVLNKDFTLKPIRNVTVGARMSYAKVFDGLKERIYYANGFETGYVIDELSAPWVYSGEREGPETDREFVGPPIGTMVRLYKGRVFVVHRHMAWYSEAYDHSAFDPTRNVLQFESDIQMFRPVENGVYVSDRNGVFFLEGDASRERFFSKKHCLDYPAVRGTDVPFTGVLDLSAGVPLIRPGMGKVNAIFVTTQGICVGSEGGDVYNLTEEKIDFPMSSRGCGIVLNGKYISMLDA